MGIYGQPLQAVVYYMRIVLDVLYLWDAVHRHPDREDQMKIRRFLALLCILTVLCMNTITVAPSLAEAADDENATAQVQAELVSNKKKKKKKKGGNSLKGASEDSAKAEASEATEEPKATKTPKPTKEPKATKKPKATKAPEEVEVAVPEEVTPVEEEKAPEEIATPVPEETKAPETPATPIPEETKAPETPTEPEAPTEVEIPEATKEPETPTEPEATPEPEATEAPKLKLKGLKPNKSEVAPGKKVKFTLTVENADMVVWNAVRSDGLNGGSGKVKNGAFSWKPEQSGLYTITVNATTGDKTASDSCLVIVRTAPLAVEVEPAKYAQQGGEKLKYEITINGGCEPYTMNTVVKYKGDKIFTSQEVLEKVVCDALGFGDNKLTVTVTDGVGDTVKVKANIVSASNEKNDAPPLPPLEGDMTFAEKLVAVAKSQQGYRESQENFILQGGDAVQGWSFYGGWYGAPYEEWCAMFVSYCLVNAGIGEDIMPHSGNCNRWKGDLGARYIDDEDDYIPEPGDIIFFHHNRVSNDPNYPNHIGIVTKYDAGSDTVYTVEGNSGKSVRDRQYERGSNVIVGYASMRACMLEHDSVYREQLGDQLASNLEAFRAQYSEKD